MTHKRTWPTYAVLVVAVLALALGSVSTAAAGGLTTKVVKKIATKVVRKQAHTLSVASAANAGSAATVGGLPASALQERRTVYSITVSPAISSFARTIPLPGPGSYEVSYSAYLELAATNNSECYLERSSGSGLQDYADDASTGAGNFTAHSGVDVVTMAAGDVLAFHCTAGAVPFTTSTSEPIHVVVTPLDAVTTVVLGP